MRQLGINKQILVIAILPALAVSAILSTYYIWNQLEYISESLNRDGILGSWCQLFYDEVAVPV